MESRLNLLPEVTRKKFSGRREYLGDAKCEYILSRYDAEIFESYWTIDGVLYFFIGSADFANTYDRLDVYEVYELHGEWLDAGLRTLSELKLGRDLRFKDMAHEDRRAFFREHYPRPREYIERRFVKHYEPSGFFINVHKDWYRDDYIEDFDVFDLVP